jgi:uridine kinase
VAVTPIVCIPCAFDAGIAQATGARPSAAKTLALGSDPVRPVLIGIAGGSGSGKTTLATALCTALGDATLISHDSYYRDLAHLDADRRAQTNFDHPASLDTDLLAEHLYLLRANTTVEVPVYDFTTHARTGEHRPVSAPKVIVVDGVLLFTHPKVVSLLDHRVFVAADTQTRFDRRLRRDVAQRGRTAESVRQQFERTVEPMHRAFVDPSSVHADRVVTPADRLDVVCEELLTLVDGLCETIGSEGVSRTGARDHRG